MCILSGKKRARNLRKMPKLGVQTWSPFVTQKSGHIWQIWAEMTQTLMPKSTKVAQIHLSECNSANTHQIFPKILPKFRQNLPQISAKIRQISFQKRALTLNTQPKKNARDTGRVALGHPAGQPGVCRPVSRGFPVVYKRSGASFRRGDFAPREPEFDPEFGDANF